ncbi:MAG: BFD-like (2Fe-2S) protein [Desulfobacterales bacterium]|nr:MAG: BFD-like (2Fe-2S) protein [Desulfobacterales bacterium]
MTNEKICYCFNYTVGDIRNDFHENGKSTIMDRILNEKKDGNCSCNSTSPKGR